ncbi:MAG: hypothetical protein AAF149_09440 [Bacteroidota bacterium]
MSKKKVQNSIDNIFQEIFTSITSVKNYELALENNEAVELLTFFTQHILDISNYHILYKATFIPAANKTVARVKREYLNSKYKQFISAGEIDLKESLYETIRLGYVGLSHKIEGFTKGIKRNNALLKKAYEIEGDFVLTDYLLDTLSIDLLNPINVPRLNKVRIISNAVKHNNGYPQMSNKEKDNIKIHMSWLDMDSKINIDPKNFINDIKFTIDFFEFVNRLVHTFTMLYITHQNVGTVSDKSLSMRAELITKFKTVVNLYTTLR